MLKNIVKKIYHSIITVFKNLLIKERSAHKLALSVAVGLYIAFSPFLFMHTIMVLAFSWIFSLNMGAVFVGAVVNNPWTIVPCHTAGYIVGEFFLKSICGLDSLALNPTWMAWVNKPVIKITGMQGISLWSFMVGGNLLAILVSVILYPVLRVIFMRLSNYIGDNKEK